MCGWNNWGNWGNWGNYSPASLNFHIEASTKTEPAQTAIEPTNSVGYAYAPGFNGSNYYYANAYSATVSVVNPSSDDHLSFDFTGTNFAVSGNQILLNGVTFATFSGQGTPSLSLNFNSQQDYGDIALLLERVTFINGSANPPAYRDIQFVVQESDGSNSSAQVRVDIVPAAPTALADSAIVNGFVNNDNNTASQALTGMAAAGTTVTVYDGTTNLGTATAATDGSWSLSLGKLTEGAHSLTARITDTAGVTGPASATLAFTVDTIAPSVTASESVSGWTNSTSDTIRVNAADTGSGIASVEVYDNGHDLGAATLANGAWSLTASGLAEGSHVFTATATDVAGNTSAAVSAGAADQVDVTPPMVTGSEAVSGRTNSTTDAISVTAADSRSGVASVEVYDNGQALGAATLGPDGNWHLTASGLSEGSHAFTATATDVAGNTSAAVSAGAADQVDVTPPTLAIDPLGFNVLNLSRANAGLTITGTATDSGSGVNGQTIIVDLSNLDLYQVEARFTTIVSNGTWSITVPAAVASSLSSGNYVVTAQAADVAGNINPFWGPRFTVDTSPPVVTASEAVSGWTNSTTDAITVTAADGGSGVSAVEVYDNGQVLGAATLGTDGNWHLTASGLSEGSHAFTATATDVAGNTSAAVSAGAADQVDTTSPTLTSIVANGPLVTNGSTVSWTVTFSEPVMGVTAGASGSAFDVTTGGISNATFSALPVAGSSGQQYTVLASFNALHPNTGNGSVSLAFTGTGVTDRAGNPVAGGSLTAPAYTIDTTPPAVTLALASDSGLSQTDNITSNPAISGSGDPNAIVAIGEGGNVLGSATADASGDWSFTPSLADGAHTLMASETDAAGNTGSATVSFTFDTAAPVLSPVSDQVLEATGPNGAAASFSAIATDLVDGSDGVSFAEGNTPVQSGQIFGLGTHTITAGTQDAAGNVSSENFTVTVQDTTAPVLSPMANQVLEATGPNGAAAAFSATATDIVDGTDPVSFSENGQPVQSGQTFGLGAHTITAGTQDAAGNVSSETFTVTVQDTIAPSVTVNESVSGWANSTSDTITVNAADAGSGVASVEVYDNGHDLGAATLANGAWSLTASGLAEGSHAFTATATDVVGNTSAAVSAGAADQVDVTAPSVTASESVSGWANSTSDTITVNAADAGSGVASVEIYDNGHDLGAATLANSAWSLTASGLAEGSHAFTATATDVVGNTSAAVSAGAADQVDTTAPRLTVATIAGDNVLNLGEAGTGFVIGGTAADNASGINGQTVTVTIANASNTLVETVTGAVSGGTWSGTVPSSEARELTNGAYTVTATMADLAGNRVTATRTLTVDEVPPNAPSMPELGNALGAGAPNRSNVVAATNPSFVGTAEANSIVRLYDGTTPVGIGQANAQGQWMITSSQLATGSHSITATATDAAGNTSAASTALQVSAYNPQATAQLYGSLIGNLNIEIGDQNAMIVNGSGDAFVLAGNGNDLITLGGSTTATHTVYVGNGNDALSIAYGTNQVILGNGTDNVGFASGINTVHLGSGSYTFTESSGAIDTLMFSSARAMVNTPLGSSDRLVFSNSGFDLGIDNGSGTATPQAIDPSLLSRNNDGTFATTANRFAYDHRNGNLWYDADGSGSGSAPQLIADLSNKPHVLGAGSLFFTG